MIHRLAPSGRWARRRLPTRVGGLRRCQDRRDVGYEAYGNNELMSSQVESRLPCGHVLDTGTKLGVEVGDDLRDPRGVAVGRFVGGRLVGVDDVAHHASTPSSSSA